MSAEGPAVGPLVAAVAKAEADGADWGLPFYDVRLDGAGMSSKAVSAKVEAWRDGVGGDAWLGAVRALTARDPMLVIDEDAVLGTARFVRSTARLLTGPSPKTDGVDVVRGYVAAWPGLMQIDPKEIDLARRSRDYVTTASGMRHLTFQQLVRGRDLFGAEVRASVAADGSLINISSTMLPRPEGDFAVAEPVVTDAAAVLAAATNVGVRFAAAPVPAGEPEGASLKRAWAHDAGVRADEPTTTEAIYFPLDRETVRPAWLVVIAPPGVGHTYEVVVDGLDGRVLWRHDRLVWATTQPVTVRVYTADSPAPGSPGRAAPDGVQMAAAARALVTLQPSDVSAFSPNGWINDGGTLTTGNNCDAHLDLNNSNPTAASASAVRADGGAGRVFDFAHDLGQEPGASQSAAITQMFYRVNLFHDRMYALGFDEGAGNFQAVNFTGRGTGNDAVMADVQDSVGLTATVTNRNNANFSTGGNDGSSARVQMYVWTGPAPDRDGVFETDVVYHELAHGVSIRLHGGLNAEQSRGMGEGWSDFFGLALLAEPGDDIEAAYPMGPWATYQLGFAGFTTNYYYGIRRYPYSTDLAKNASTYADIDPDQASLPSPISPISGGSADESHNIGQVWATALHECRAAMVRRYGFAGNERMMRMVIDGMKLSVANPTLLQARDAILQANLVTRGGVDQAALWAAFARRGMGLNATSPASTTTTGVVESFAVPTFVFFEYPDGIPSRLEANQAATFRVKMTGNGLVLSPGTAALTYRVDGGSAATLTLSQDPAGGAGEYVAVIPAQGCGSAVSFRVSTGTSGGVQADPPPTALEPERSFRANVAPPAATPALVSDSFETAAGWGLAGGDATAGLWTRVTPVGTLAAPGADHTPGGTACFVTGQGQPGGAIGLADVDGGATVLQSPALDLSGQTDALVTYWRWYANGVSTNGPYQDTLRVEVSTNNGQSWTPAETVGPGDSRDPDVQPGWRFAAWKLSSLGLTPTSQVRVRFTAEDAGAGSIIEAGLDDFAVYAAPCGPPPCAADFNGNGTADLLDIFGFLNAWFSQSLAADFNHNNLAELSDIFGFLNAWFAGCP